MTNGYNLANVVNTKAYAVTTSDDVTAMAARDHEVGKASQELIAVCYRQCKVKNKIQTAMKNAYLPYCSVDDFNSLYFVTIQKCVSDYREPDGPFLNYLNKALNVAFKNEKKSGFLKVTGNIPKERRDEMKSVPVQNYMLGRKSKDHNETEQEMMNKTLLHDVAAIDDGELLLYKFSDPDKVKSDKAVGVKYGLSEKQVRTRIGRVVQAFKQKSPTFFTDYYYDTDNADTNICLQVA